MDTWCPKTCPQIQEKVIIYYLFTRLYTPKLKVFSDSLHLQYQYNAKLYFKFTK